MIVYSFIIVILCDCHCGSGERPMNVGKEMESSGDVRLGCLHGGSVYVFARLENEIFDHCIGQSFSALCQLAGQCLMPVISASLDDYNPRGPPPRSERAQDYGSV